VVGTPNQGVQQGYSVALSADGNTAIVGGPYDDSFTGAAWVFIRSNGIWAQQGNKLVGTGTSAQQGSSVALSGDGNTTIVGGPRTAMLAGPIAGGAWVYTRSGNVWTQQGNMLVGTGGGAGQGSSVALSTDGNTAIVGGHFDSANTGAAWIFTRSGGVWTQQGNKLAGTDAIPPALQGFSVALSGDGNKQPAPIF
jgi:hypothetical protein